MPIVCDRIFECPGWEKSYRQINDAIVFCHNQSAGPKYAGIPFKFCPWCGKEIKCDRIIDIMPENEPIAPADGLKFCPKCKDKLEVAEACPHCGYSRDY